MYIVHYTLYNIQLHDCTIQLSCTHKREDQYSLNARFAVQYVYIVAVEVRFWNYK